MKPKLDAKTLGPLAGLPYFRITSTPATTREQTAQKDVIYGVKSLDDVAEEFGKRLNIRVKKRAKKRSSAL